MIIVSNMGIVQSQYAPERWVEITLTALDKHESRCYNVHICYVWNNKQII